MADDSKSKTIDTPNDGESIVHEDTVDAQPPQTEHQNPVFLTKRALKRLLKSERREAERPLWVARRKEKRQRIKEQRRQRKQAGDLPQTARRRDAPIPSGVEVVIDCDFDDLMKESERTSLAKQITRIYSINNHSVHSVKLKVHSFNKLLAKRFIENMHSQHERWHDIEFSADTFEPTPNTIYLSSDAQDVLTCLEPGKTYIVGGIVDKGRYRNLCKDKAERLNIPTARLPIDEYIKLNGRRVLTTNHVVELMLKWLECKDWATAFKSVLPPRRLINPKNALKDAKIEDANTNRTDI